MDQLRPVESAQSTNNVNPQNLNGNGQDITQLVMGQKPETPDTKTREFSVADMKEEPSKIKIDFFGGSNPNDFIKQPTEQAKTLTPTMGGLGETKYINPMIGPGGGIGIKVDPAKVKEDMASGMRTFIAIMDYALSLAGMYLSGEGTQTQYTADSQQKKLLETALVDYCYEKQVKLSAGFALFLAFLGAYGFMIIAALKKRIELMQKKKGLDQKNIPINKQYEIKKEERPISYAVTDQDMKRYQDINPPVKAPVEKPILETVYVENKIDGTMTPQRVPINPNQFPKWFNPDATIIAKTREELNKYLARGVYPKFLKNKTNSGVLAISYDANTGEPKLKGKPARVNKKS